MRPRPAQEWAKTRLTGRPPQPRPRMSHCACTGRLVLIRFAVIKDAADLIEKPLHLLGLHAGAAIAVVVLVTAALGAGSFVWWRRRLSTP